MAPSRAASGGPLHDDGDRAQTSDERTPLLAAVPPAPITADAAEESPREIAANGVHVDDEDAPLPKLQIFLLCCCRLVEPIAFFSIFPYINSMIEKTVGVDPKHVGYYSGLIESLFSATQMCVMLFWGKAADRYGRKPCLVISLFGVALATALFGMSTNLWQMIMARCFAGVFAGTLVTVRAMITENSTKKTQARAFSFFAFAGNIGICVGPFIGGLCERPAEKFPSTFGKVRFFHEYPYAFPGFVSAAVGLSAAILGALFLKETLHLKGSKGGATQAPMSTWELINYPGVARVWLIYTVVCLLGFTYTAVCPVFLYTKVADGGIGFAPGFIAGMIALNGTSQAIWLVGIFPLLHRRIGTGGILRLCAWAWPFFMAVHPICNAFLRHDLTVLFWILGPFNVVFGSGVAMAFTGTQLALNDIAPSHETLGSLNAIALAGSSGLRAIAPALATAIYASGVTYQILAGYLFWVIIIIITLIFIGVVRLLPKKAEGKLQRDEDDEA